MWWWETVRRVLGLGRRRPTGKWSPKGWNGWTGLHTIEDYRECAYGASPAVKFVKVRAIANDPRMPPGEVEVRVQGLFHMRVQPTVLAEVRDAIVLHKPINVALRVISW